MTLPFKLGYNTNGLAHHDLVDAIEILAEIGYESVAITLDRQCFAADSYRYLSRIRRAIEQAGMNSIVETGGRFLLDRNCKHEPTLMTADEAGREKRIEFYRNAIEIANDFGTNVVSIWSGILHERLGHQEAMNRLVSGLEEVLAEAEKHDVTVGFEPEPGMFIDTMARYDALKAKLPSPSLKLTLDIGHLHCQGELPIAEYVKRYAGELVNVHIEDMRRGVHEHLPLGEGEIHFPPVLQAIAESNYSGGVHVELSRHSHDGPPMAKRAYEFLRKTMDRTGWSG